MNVQFPSVFFLTNVRFCKYGIYDSFLTWRELVDDVFCIVFNLGFSHFILLVWLVGVVFLRWIPYNILTLGFIIYTFKEE